jgi:hypothetical protein
VGSREKNDEGVQGKDGLASPRLILGDSVMALNTGVAIIVYQDGCKVEVSSKTAVVRVQETHLLANRRQRLPRWR